MIAARAAPILAILAVGCVPAAQRDVAPPPVGAPTTEIAPTRPPAKSERTSFVIEAGPAQQGGWLRGHAPSTAIQVKFGESTVDVGNDGAFFLGIDRDAPASLQLTATLADGHTVTTVLSIASRDWPIERINVPLRGSVPNDAFMAIRRPELAAIAAARGLHSDSAGWSQRFIWPVSGRISGRFGAQRVYQGVPGAYHSGLDIAPGAGVPYVSPADGVVVLAAEKPFSLEGYLLIVDHGRGLNSAFLHSTRLAVKKGDRVRQGQLIGYVGATGRASGPHLHWSIKWQDARLDPLLFLPPQ